jgi:hypothetical protein
LKGLDVKRFKTKASIVVTHGTQKAQRLIHPILMRRLSSNQMYRQIFQKQLLQIMK